MTRMTRWGLAASLGLLACGEQTEPPPDEGPARLRLQDPWPGPAEGNQARAEPARSPEPAGPATRRSIVDLWGTPHDPLDPAAPGVAVLLFVSTECPISNRYAPTLRSLARQWSEDGVRPWLVYPDPDDDPAAIRSHQAEYSLSLPTVRDPRHVLVAQAGARVTPEAAVFGPGAVAAAYVGRIDDRVVERGKVRAEASAHELRDAVRAVRAGRSPTAAGGPAIGCTISDLR